ncbi:MAG: hypothetical protein M3N93_14345 [Acidobacteriota bacterium]|nr:hypothetical protein [Acidobacteriota bacterium]
MFRYTAYGLSIHSDLEFANLPPGSELIDVAIRFGHVPDRHPMATLREEIAHHAKGGWFHIREGREIVLDPPAGADPDLLRVLLLGRMMAFLLRQRGWLSLHASGVELAGKAVLFIGRSGSGKSTLAAACHARGHRVITDDVAAVRLNTDGKCVVQPAGPRIRLLDDARAVFNGREPAGIFQWRKHFFDLPGDFPPQLLCVDRVYLLAWGSRIGCDLVPALSAAAQLSTNSFVRHQRMDKPALTAHLRHVSLVTRSVTVGNLYRRYSIGDLADVVRWVESDRGDER